MITKVWGSCNSMSIVFNRTDTGRWKAVCPVNYGGVHVLELYAEDIVGNVGYLATIVFTIDLKNICTTIKFLEDGKARFRRYYRTARLVEVAKPNKALTTTVVGFKDFQAKVVKCSVCKGW